MARYDGIKSWDILLRYTFGKPTNSSTIKGINAHGGLTPNVTSLMLSGYYDYEEGILLSRTNYNFYWESWPTKCLVAAVGRMAPQYSNAKGFGASVRRVAKLATDSICPKGWEMARNSGDGSWRKLIITIYGKEEIEESLSNSRPYGGLKSNPLSLNYTGNYGHSTGNPASRTSQARYRQSRSSVSSAPTLAFSGTTLHVDYPNMKGYGFSLHCVAQVINKNCL